MTESQITESRADRLIGLFRATDDHWLTERESRLLALFWRVESIAAVLRRLEDPVVQKTEDHVSELLALQEEAERLVQQYREL